MTSLYFRAAKRCEQNILRVWPAWRQAHITDADRGDFEDWKAVNVAHLRALQDQIVKGGEPDIDRGWPTGSIPEQPVPEPAPAPVADPEEAKAAIMRGLGKIEETGAKLKERPEAPEPEPEEVVPDEVKQALKEAGIDWRDSREAVSNALIAKYRYYKGAAEYARKNDTFDGRGVIYWEKKAEGIDDATAWNRARVVETL